MHSPGACSRVPLILLERAGVPYDLRIVRLQQGAHLTPEFLALNPKGKVPVLMAGPDAITDNLAIAAWLALEYPHAQLLPPTSRALEFCQALSWLAFSAANLHPLVFRARMAHRVVEGEGPQQSARQLAVHELERQLAIADAQLSERLHLVGPVWSAADAYLLWCAQRAAESGARLANLHHLQRFIDRMNKEPAVERAIRKEAAATAAHHPQPEKA
ncbi:MAG: glutathione S-transferase family protein [Pseudomonadota bacterium]